MALNVADIVAHIRAQGVSEFVSELERGKKSTASFTDSVGKFGAAVAGVGKKLTIGATLPIVGLGLVAIDAASDLAEATSAVNTVYAASAGIIIENSNAAAQAIGMSREQYRSAAAQLGVYAQAAGLTGDEMANFSSSLIQAAGDLSSFYNVSSPEALGAIRAGLTGEYESLRRFGILLNETTVNEYAWANGIAAVGAALTEEQKVLARQALIMEGLGAAEGNYALTAGDLANQRRTLAAEMRNFAADIGAIMLPMALKLVGGIRSVISFMSKLHPSFKTGAVVVLGLVAALGPLLFILGTLISSAATVAGAVGGIGAAFGLLLGPVGLVIAGLVGLYAAYQTNFLGFGDGVRTVAGWVSDAVGSVVDVFGQLRDYFNYIIEGGNVWNAHMAGIPEPLRNIALVVGTVIRAIQGFIDVMVGGGSLTAAWQVFLSAFQWWRFRDALNEIIDSLRGFSAAALDWTLNVGLPALGGAVWDLAKGAWSWLIDQIPGVLDFAHDAIKWTLNVGVPALNSAIGNVWDWVKGKLGIGTIPGDASGGPEMDRRADIGTWWVYVAVPGLQSAVKNVWEWVKDKLGIGVSGGGPGTVGGGAGGGAGGRVADLGAWWVQVAEPGLISVVHNLWGWFTTDVLQEQTTAEHNRIWHLGKWTLEAPPPDVPITLPIVFGWLDSTLQQIVGVEVELQDWKWKIKNPQDDLTLHDVNAWLDAAMEDIIGINIEIQNWKGELILGETNLITGAVELRDWLDNQLEQFVGVDLEIHRWKGELIFGEDNLVTSAFEFQTWLDEKLEKLVGVDIEIQEWRGKLILGDTNLVTTAAEFTSWLDVRLEAFTGVDVDLQDWHLDLDVPHFWNIADDVIGWIDNFLENLTGVDVELQNWGLTLGVPDISLGGGATPGPPADVNPAPPETRGPTLPGVTPVGGAANISAILIGMIEPTRQALAELEQMFAADPFALLTASVQKAAALVTNATLAIEVRVKGMAAVVTMMAGHAGDGFHSMLSQGTQRAVAAFTNATLSGESRARGFAAAVTVAALNAGDGFYAGVRLGADRALAALTNATLAGESRLRGFANAATVAGFNGGDGFASGVSQGMARAGGAADAGRNRILNALRLPSQFGAGLFVGSTLGEGIAAGINRWLQNIANAAANAVNTAINAARAAAGNPMSPSPVMLRLVGIPLAQGILEPLEGISSKLSPLMQGINRNLTDAAGTILDTIRGMVASGEGFAAQQIANAMIGKYTKQGMTQMAADFADSLAAAGWAQAEDSAWIANPAQYWGTAPLPLPPSRMPSAGTGGGNTYLVIDGGQLRQFIEAAQAFQVLTSPEEIAATWGS
jgi:hypothetical protein